VTVSLWILEYQVPQLDVRCAANNLI